MKAAFTLLHRLHYVYWSNAFLVPVEERSGLLSAISSRADIKPGHFVQIRAGLYRKDIAQVLSVDEQNGFLRVRVVPRLAPPVLDKKPQKRLKTKRTRPAQLRLSAIDIRHRYKLNKVKILPNGFEFQSKEFDEDGFRIIAYSRDSVSLIKPTLMDISQFIDGTVDHLRRKHLDSDTSAMIDYTDQDVIELGRFDLAQISKETLVRVGYEVEIVDGPSKGKTGIAVEVAANGNVLVSYTDRDTTTEDEVPADAVRIKFKVGDSIFVKFGVYAGRKGLVESADHRTLVVRESGTYDEASYNITRNE